MENQLTEKEIKQGYVVTTAPAEPTEGFTRFLSWCTKPEKHKNDTNKIVEYGNLCMVTETETFKQIQKICLDNSYMTQEHRLSMIAKTISNQKEG